MESPKKYKEFQDYYEVIIREIQKRKNRWTLSSLHWIDFLDVQQIILTHIWKKWHLYDQKKPIGPWLNVIISHQIKNIIRNVYSNFSRPCLKCEAAYDGDKCKIYGEQCVACPLYENWKRKKEPATQIKLPVSIENHSNEVSNIFDEGFDISGHIEKANIVMKNLLKPVEYKVYESLFIKHEDEVIVAKQLGYISNERGRNPGYKQIKNIRKSIIEKFKRAIENGDIDI